MYIQNYSYFSREQVEELEKIVQDKIKSMADSQIMEEVEHWVIELRYSRTRETKYLRIEKVYWMVDVMISQDLEKKKEEQ